MAYILTAKVSTINVKKCVKIYLRFLLERKMLQGIVNICQKHLDNGKILMFSCFLFMLVNCIQKIYHGNGSCADADHDHTTKHSFCGVVMICI